MVASGLVDRLARDHLVIVPDRPGYGIRTGRGGRSGTPERQAELLLGFIEKLGLQKPVVVGDFLGRAGDRRHGGRGAQRLRGLVLLAGYYYPTARLDVAVSTGQPSR